MERNAEIITHRYRPRNGRKAPPTTYTVVRYENGQEVSRDTTRDRIQANAAAKEWGIIEPVYAGEYTTICAGAYNWAYNGRKGTIHKDRVGGTWAVYENGKHGWMTVGSLNEAKQRIEA